MVDLIVKPLKKLFKIQNPDMDSISSTAEFRSKIADKTGNVYMKFVTIYLMFSINGWDPIVYMRNILFSSIPNDFAKLLLEVCLMFISAKAVYNGLYKLVENRSLNQWKTKNKDIWIKGTWLHVHDKKDVRIGDVLIEQDLYTISVDGNNLALPKANNISEISNKLLDYSDWYYTMAKIVNNENENTLYGYYTSVHGKKRKKGMHALTFGYMNDYPIFLSGTFNDVVEESGQEISKALGELRLYKLSTNCPYYNRIINKKTGRIDYCELVLLINEFYKAHQKALNGEDTQFENYDIYIRDEFLRDIIDVIQRRGWSKPKEVEKPTI